MENVFKKHIGKVIDSIDMFSYGSFITIYFTDGSGVSFIDKGQSCCEKRYMHTEDDLTYYKGSKFLGATLKDGPSVYDDDNWINIDVSFLIIHTDRGEFTINTYNEHNGYYGGFDIVCEDV